jgi:hypothetical protein
MTFMKLATEVVMQVLRLTAIRLIVILYWMFVITLTVNVVWLLWTSIVPGFQTESESFARSVVLSLALLITASRWKFNRFSVTFVILEA